MLRAARRRILLGGLTPARFLESHWQKRPLLVRQAFPGLVDPLTPDELAGLACEPEVESRLVMELGPSRRWQLFHGPQDPRRLRRLPRSRWSLLVQEVDKHLPAVAALLEPFDFVPRWRLDDVMVSFAPRGGTVGPHVDGYDVFLVQGRGRRRWQVSTRDPSDFRPGLDLRILKRFRPEAEWVLEPGDMLYVPPGVAHHGVSLEDALTYSVGFRAPGRADVLLRVLERVVNTTDGERRYEDPDLRPVARPGEIGPDALRRLRAVVEAETSRVLTGEFARLMGELLTEPKSAPPRPRARHLPPPELHRRLRAGGRLGAAPTSRTAFVRRGRAALLFVDGRTHELPPELAGLAPLVTSGRALGADELRPWLSRRAARELLSALVDCGALQWRGRRS